MGFVFVQHNVTGLRDYRLTLEHISQFCNQAQDQTNTARNPALLKACWNYAFGPQYKIPAVSSTNFHQTVKGNFYFWKAGLWLSHFWISFPFMCQMLICYDQKRTSWNRRNVTLETLPKPVLPQNTVISTPIPHALSCLVLIESTNWQTNRKRSFNEHHYCCVIFTLDRFKSLYNHDQTRPAEQVMLLANINWKIMNIISVLKQLLVYSLGRLMWDLCESGQNQYNSLGPK